VELLCFIKYERKESLKGKWKERMGKRQHRVKKKRLEECNFYKRHFTASSD
jgi:hypothetical protein